MPNVSDYLHAKASRRKVPLSGTFELSPVCNFACKMCYVRKTPEQIRREGKALIPWQAWLELAKQCRDAGTLYLLLTTGICGGFTTFSTFANESVQMLQNGDIAGFIGYVATSILFGLALIALGYWMVKAL